MAAEKEISEIDRKWFSAILKAAATASSCNRFELLRPVQAQTATLVFGSVGSLEISVIEENRPHIEKFSEVSTPCACVIDRELAVRLTQKLAQVFDFDDDDIKKILEKPQDDES